jgi:plasmid stabilization system protein ParE
MSRRTILYTHGAARDVKAIDDWWRGHRLESPNLFITELRKTVAILAVAPMIGVAASSERIAGVRRALLRRTGHHVYYRVRDDLVEVLAVWHGARAEGPF